MGIYFNSNQSLLTSGSYVVASDQISPANGNFAPMFHMGRSVYPVPQAAYIEFQTTYVNSRGLWSGSTFTAPTTGLYWFYFHAQLEYNNQNRYVEIRKNSSSSWALRIYSSSMPDQSHLSGYKLFYMNEGDTCRVYNANAGLFGGNNYMIFSGGLIQ